MTEPAITIDEVIERLTAIIAQSKVNQSRLGYFAALYRKVTCRVKECIDQGNYFDSNERMERLDVIFANRYLTAFDQMQSAGDPTRCWDFAFDVTEEYWPIVLQHLLLGINAHINLDLGIAAVETVGHEGLPDLHDDFNRINDLLFELVGEVKEELAWVWPPLRWLNRYLGNVEDSIINFSMTAARDAAWDFAQRLGPLNDSERTAAIEHRDGEIVLLAHGIRYPGIILGGVTKAVRLGERGTVVEIIKILK